MEIRQNMSFTCKLCQSKKHLSMNTKDAKNSQILSISLCQQCGLLQQTPIPSDKDVEIYYSHNYREDYKNTYSPKLKHIKRAGVVALSRIDFLNKNISITKKNLLKLLDIGAGGGEFVYLSSKSGFISDGIEPNKGYSEYSKAQYGISIKTMMLKDLEPESYDIVTLFHVFEHMTNPDSVMQKIWQTLKPNGVFFVEVPNILSKNASPHNIYFKAHIFYYCRYTLEFAASKYFDVMVVDDSRNLRMLLKKKEVVLEHAVLPSTTDVEFIKQRVTKHGWIDYLFVGDGLSKIVKRLARLKEEKKIMASSPKALLDSLLENEK